MSETAKDIVDSLNHTHYIPAIQRRFVWTKEQISMYFDSILREFPIGQMLVLELDVDEVSDDTTYEFVSNYVSDDISGFSDGNHNNPRIEKVGTNPVKLVFDGQQRLTALNIGLNGCIYMRENKYKEKSEENYVKKFLCMELTSDPDELVEDAELFDQQKGGKAPKYSFRFKKEENIGWDEQSEEYWFKVPDITSLEHANKVNNFVRESDIPQKLFMDATANLMRLQGGIHRTPCIDIKEVNEKDSDEMLEIFLRMNRGGTHLNDKDTALSIMTYKWDDSRGTVAREAIEEYVSRVNQRFGMNRNPMSEKTMIQMLRVCSMPESNISSYRPKIDIQELTDQQGNLCNSMEKVWKNKDFEDAVDTYIKLCKDFAIPTGRIGSSVVFAPIISYLYSCKNPVTDKEIDKGLLNRQKVLYWMSSCVSLGLTSYATLSTATSAVKTVFTSDTEQFPLRNIVNNLDSDMLLDYEKGSLNSSDINDNFYADRRSEFLLKLMHIHKFSRQEYETTKSYDKDHIFPKSKTDSEMVNKLGNIQYIKSSTNNSKRDDDFDSWMDNTTQKYCSNHYIPNLETYTQPDFEEFVNEREKLIQSSLNDLYKHLTTESTPVRKHPNKISEN